MITLCLEIMQKKVVFDNLQWPTNRATILVKKTYLKTQVEPPLCFGWMSRGATLETEWGTPMRTVISEDRILHKSSFV